VEHLGVGTAIVVAPESDRRRGPGQPQVVDDDLAQPYRQDGIDNEQLEGRHRLQAYDRVDEESKSRSRSRVGVSWRDARPAPLEARQ
jgi:hypothetical protein